MDTLPNFVPAKTVAGKFSVTADTAIRWMRQGMLPGAVQVGRRWYMRADVLEKLAGKVPEQPAAAEAPRDDKFWKELLNKRFGI